MAILLKNALSFTIFSVANDKDGRYLILDIDVFNTRITLATVYGPNSDDPIFFETFFSALRSFPNSDVIIAGDWNVHMNVNLDKVGGNPVTSFRARAVIEEATKEFSLVDIWRIRHPVSKEFTFTNPTPLRKSRIDYFLVSTSCCPLVTTCSIDPGYLSDHRSVSLTLNLLKIRRGPGFWKLNVSLLDDKNYVMKITELIFETLNDCSLSQSSPFQLWEFLKSRIRGESISYATHKKKSSLIEINEVMEDIQSLYSLQAQGSHDEETQNRLSENWRRLDQIISERATGAMVRVRVR